MNDICKDIWFTIRLLDLEVKVNNNDNDTKDSLKCLQICNDTHKCSYIELKGLKDIDSKRRFYKLILKRKT